jgi:hypothetical protein
MVRRAATRSPGLERVAERDPGVRDGLPEPGEEVAEGGRIVDSLREAVKLHVRLVSLVARRVVGAGYAFAYGA